MELDSKMSLNRVYVGYPMDLNIGCGKTVSAVGAIMQLWAESVLANSEKTIFSNIKLMNVDYQLFTPKNIYEVLETKNALVLLDELHSIIHKNHRISESCGKHSIKGLCYHLSEFFRQVRKRDIETYTTCQTLSDVFYQGRLLMNVQIYCELGHLEGNRWKKCTPLKYPQQKCPEWHRHRIRHYITPNDKPWQSFYFNPEPYYNNYDSYEIVKGWVQMEVDDPIKKTTGTDIIKGW